MKHFKKIQNIILAELKIIIKNYDHESDPRTLPVLSPRNFKGLLPE